MTLPVELEASVNQLRLKHAALIDAVNAYRSGTIDASKQELLEMADKLEEQLDIEERTLLGQVARKAKLHPAVLPFLRYGPLSMFMNGEQGAWYDPSDLNTLFQDAEGTTPVTADGDPVGLMLDKSGNGNHASQVSSAARPIYRSDGQLHWLEFDGVDDWLRASGFTWLTAGDYSTEALVGLVYQGDNDSAYILHSTGSVATGASRFAIMIPIGGGLSFRAGIQNDFPATEVPRVVAASFSRPILAGTVSVDGIERVMKVGNGTGISDTLTMGGRTPNDPQLFLEGRIFGTVIAQRYSPEILPTISDYLARKSGVILP